MSSEDIPVEEPAPEVQPDEHMESAEECVVKEIGTEINDNNIGGDELDYEENDTSATTISNGDNDEQEKQENVSNGVNDEQKKQENDDQEMQENAENIINGESCEQKKDDGVEQEAVEEAHSSKLEEETNSITKDNEKDGESTQIKGEDGSDAKSQPTQQVESEESEVINCKEFDVTVLVAEDEKVVAETVADKVDGNAVAGKGDEKVDEKKEATETKEGNPSGIETDPTLVCKPCNLVFESDKWCSRHKESGDHLHVVKGGVPGRGRYHCFLCWMSFQHSEGLVHHIGRSDHLKRSKRKGVKSIWMKPGASGAAGISTGDLRAQITGRGDLRDHLTDKRDHLTDKRDHLDDRKRREDSRALHRDRDRRGHHHRSRSPVRIYLDQFYEVSSVGDCDMGNCKSLRKIVTSSKEKSKEDSSKEKSSSNKSKEKEKNAKEESKENTSINNSSSKDDKIEGGNEEKKEANQDTEEKKTNGIVEKKDDNADEDMETDEREQNHEVAEGKDANDDQNAKETDNKSDELMDVNDAQNNKEDDVNHQSGADERFENNEESNKNEIINEDATEKVSEDTEMETEDKKDNSVNDIDQSDDQVNNKSCPPESETSEKNDVVENCEDITEQLQPE